MTSPSYPPPAPSRGTPWMAVCEEGSTRSFATEVECREWVWHADEVTAGNLTYYAMPVSLALSAPALLAACEAALEDHDGQRGPKGALRFDTLDALRSALTLARGGAS